jgi:ankyrin repeat protein
VLSAAREHKWATVNELLDYAIKNTAQGNRRDVKLDDVFSLAATSREERLEVLEKIWAFTNQGIGQEICDFSLYQATVLRKDAIVVWLLETCKANANATAEKPSSTIADSTAAAPISAFSTALNAAAGSGNVALVKSLLKRGAEIDGDRGYALQLAASEGHTEVVQVLLERGALVNKVAASSEEVGFFSGTALQAACENSRTDVVAALLAHGADPNLGGGRGAVMNPIIAATQGGHADIVKILLGAPDVDVNVIDGDEYSNPLINAATHMSTEIVELLLRKGADINAKNAAGDTALIIAALKGDVACVEMLCTNGADITYRSPVRGLAIQVAAEALNPLCAHVLAEKIAGMIDHYGEKGLSDAGSAQKRWEIAQAELRDRESTIDTFNGILAESKEQLEILTKDVEVHQLEKKRLMSISSFQGETYESIGQQMKVMQSERVELMKQVDSWKGQVELANDTIARMQALLDDERQTNAALRKRQGWATLQEAKQAAEDMLEVEKQNAVQTSALEKQKRDQLEEKIRDLRYEIQLLHDGIRRLKEEVESAHTATLAAIEETEREKSEKKELQQKIRDLQANAQEVEATLASAQAAAAAAKNRAATPVGNRASTPKDHSAVDNGYFPNGAALGELGIHGIGNSPAVPTRKPVQTPGGSRAVGSRSPFSSPAMTPAMSPTMSPAALSPPTTSPRSPPANPCPNLRSPSSQSRKGFQTVHGQHRPDGALGGYRTERKMSRTASDSLYSSSIRRTSVEADSMSTDSTQSNRGSGDG